MSARVGMVAAAVLIELFPDNSFTRWVSGSPGTAIGLFVITCAVLGGVLGRRGIKLVEFKRRDA